MVALRLAGDASLEWVQGTVEAGDWWDGHGTHVPRDLSGSGQVRFATGVMGYYLAGGLGGFVLPVMFGALMDLTGIRSSAFMLMYGVVWVSLIWMYWTEVRSAELMGIKAKPFRFQGYQERSKQGTS